MKQYIIESAIYAKNNRKQYELFNRIFIFIENPLPNKVSVENVLAKIKTCIPRHAVDDLETIYIGDFKPLNDRQIDSMYVNGSIMVSNDQDTDKDLFNTLIHEIAHAIEEKYRDKIYFDGDISREFLAKRIVLFNMLKDDYPVTKKQFLDINFSQQFDDFVHKTIGYDNIGVLTSQIFMSPYGCTSLREYFANCFEHYFIEGPQEVQKVAPMAYKKIKLILSKKDI
jgi:hypothetical protein